MIDIQKTLSVPIDDLERIRIKNRNERRQKIEEMIKVEMYFAQKRSVLDNIEMSPEQAKEKKEGFSDSGGEEAKQIPESEAVQHLKKC